MQSEEQWLIEVVSPDLGEPRLEQADWRGWLHHVFLRHGAVHGPDFWSLVRDAQQQVAATASARVEADVARTTGRAVTVAAVVSDYNLRIACDGESSNDDSGGFFSMGDELALSEIASTVQDILMDEWMTVWPSCRKHDAGFHAELIDGRAAWVCRRGQHSALVGELPADS